MAKYHINAKGEPGVCRAKKACPLGDMESDHYSSPEQARDAYEKYATDFLLHHGHKSEPKESEQLELFSYDPNTYDEEGQGELFTTDEVKNAQK